MHAPPLTSLFFVSLLGLAPAVSAVIPTQHVSVVGLAGPAEILVDRWGVPHIYAGSEDDLFFAQGFNAARDRLFQIDLWRRRGLGQLVGGLRAGVSSSRTGRRGCSSIAATWPREWAALRPRTRERIATAFVAGINAYIELAASASPTAARRSSAARLHARAGGGPRTSCASAATASRAT